MGYYSDFKIEAYKGKLTKDMQTILEEISDYTFNFYKWGDYKTFTSEGSIKWYDYDNNMLQLSEEFDKVLFSLTWIGEDNEMGRTYYLNGRKQEVKAVITYEKPNMKKLKGETL